MISFSKVSKFGLASVLGVSTLLLTHVSSPEKALAQNAPEGNGAEVNENESENQTTNRLGITTGQQLLQEAETAIDAQDYAGAASKLQAARESLNDVSTGYQQLAAAFLGIDSNISSDMRQQALESAQIRDQATYRQALVYRAQDQAALSVPLLIEVIQSQGPSRELGTQAYRQLYELGFVAVSFPRNAGSDDEDSSTTSATRPLEQSDNPLGIRLSRTLIADAEQAIAAGDYGLAVNQYQLARENLNEVSGYYQQLLATFTGVDRRVADDVRARALEAAQLRDETTLQQGIAYRAQNQLTLAMPLFVEVLQSQNPTRELGQQAYQQLFEMGFVNLAYPSADETASDETASE